MSKFAVAINEQSHWAPTVVGEFVFQPKEKLHVWKGKFATNMRELAEQVNEATQFMLTFYDPTTTLRVVEVEAEMSGFVPPNEGDKSDKFQDLSLGEQRRVEHEAGLNGGPPRRAKKRIESKDLKGAFG